MKEVDERTAKTLLDMLAKMLKYDECYINPMTHYVYFSIRGINITSLYIDKGMNLRQLHAFSYEETLKEIVENVDTHFVWIYKRRPDSEPITISKDLIATIRFEASLMGASI